jgi:hypothetical protein
MRAPQFDVEVKARKASSYTQMSRNELALQFFNLGFFDPRQAEQTLLCLEMMDFDGKEALVGRIRRLAGERERLLAFRELALTLAKKYEPGLAAGLESAAAEQDAPTERGVKHLNELVEAAKAGYHCSISFVIQMNGIRQVLPNDQTHPEFGRALKRAVDAGMEIVYYQCRVEADCIEIISVCI